MRKARLGRTIFFPHNLDFNLQLANTLLKLLHASICLLELRLGDLLVEQAVLDLFLQVVELGLCRVAFGCEILVLQKESRQGFSTEELERLDAPLAATLSPRPPAPLP